MNWFEASILVMLVFITCVYLVLIYLTSPRSRPGRKAARNQGRSAPPVAYGNLPRELRGVGDEDLAEYVRNRLKLRPGLSGVVTTVKNGEVRLSGRVGSVDERELAGNVARAVPRVRLVVNELRVSAGLGEAVA